MVELVALVFAVFVFSYAMTGWARRYALSRALLDEPNVRGSHEVATPRGGGLGFVAAYAMAVSILAALGEPIAPFMLPVLAAAVLVAAVGFVDDHGHVPAAYRLLLHLLAAGWSIWWLLPNAEVWLLPILVLGVAWFVNLYNFMDGIDGLAAGQAVFLAVSVALIGIMVGESRLFAAGLSIGAAVGGFLVWNWPPARIFMGDVGSGFLGLVLGALLIHGAVLTDNPWPWLILPAVFVVDATLTLARRVLRGEPFYQAHSSHAYQSAARRWGHQPVTLAVVATGAFLLLPLAVLVVVNPDLGPAVALCVYVSLCGVAMLVGAGGAD